MYNYFVCIYFKPLRLVSSSSYKSDIIKKLYMMLMFFCISVIHNDSWYIRSADNTCAHNQTHCGIIRVWYSMTSRAKMYCLLALLSFITILSYNEIVNYIDLMGWNQFNCRRLRRESLGIYIEIVSVSLQKRRLNGMHRIVLWCQFW